MGLFINSVMHNKDNIPFDWASSLSVFLMKLEYFK